MDRSNSGSLKMDRSNSGSLIATNTKSSQSQSRSSQRQSERSNRSSGTTTLLVVLLGLLAVGQILLVTPPDPATHMSSTPQQQQQQQQITSSSSSSSLIDPTAWKLSHHLSAKVQQVAAATSTDNEILGVREPSHSLLEYETVTMNESELSPNRQNPKKAFSMIPTTTTTSTTPTEERSSDSSSIQMSTMLQEAGLTNISEADLAALPKLEQLKRQYGNIETGPVMTGMDSCERYRQQVKQRRRYAAPAGMFNTGTNALAFHLEHNLRAMFKWQVPWGKHRMESVRLTHIAPSMEKAIKEDALPIVMIRDPLHWMQSMCKQPYAAEWKHSKTHCPNLVPTEKEWQMPTSPTGAVPVLIKFDKTSKFHWDSLVDLWNDWYRQYLEADYPRLMVRFEDLLFQAPAVMKQISDCMGVDFNASQFEYQIKSAKGHGSHTDFLHAIIKSGNETARKKGMTVQDLTFAAQHLDVDLMRIFQYQSPTLPVEQLE